MWGPKAVSQTSGGPRAFWNSTSLNNSSSEGVRRGDGTVMETHERTVGETKSASLHLSPPSRARGLPGALIRHSQAKACKALHAPRSPF
jgi:hypothetical protein